MLFPTLDRLSGISEIAGYTDLAPTFSQHASAIPTFVVAEKNHPAET